MIKIGITGSLASGKTTASKIISFRRGPLFSADKAVKELYKNKHFKSLVSKRFKIKNNSQLKKSLKKLILKNKNNINKLERIIHPLVRKEMKNFVRTIRDLEKALGSGRRIMHNDELKKRNLLRRSVFLLEPARKGQCLGDCKVEFRRPGLGIHADQFELLKDNVFIDINKNQKINYLNN